mmetsp:Transcript_19808/g.54584  ORF Transcript_19808/g.54584 Transcript_19808/m.54584 type:complete len:231 (-) Transcript_19808:2613-3305(-)
MELILEVGNENVIGQSNHWGWNFLEEGFIILVSTPVLGPNENTGQLCVEPENTTCLHKLANTFAVFLFCDSCLSNGFGSKCFLFLQVFFHICDEDGNLGLELRNLIITLQAFLLNNDGCQVIDGCELIDKALVIVGNPILGDLASVFQQKRKVNFFFIVMMKMHDLGKVFHNPCGKELGLPRVLLGRLIRESRGRSHHGIHLLAEPFVGHEEDRVGPMSRRISGTVGLAG